MLFQNFFFALVVNIVLGKVKIVPNSKNMTCKYILKIIYLFNNKKVLNVMVFI